ncbi:hypothetical protein JAAARDRAFT_30812 [Jaapia argillacea MUCL 33604]|uniref:Uncharacterized protein n=1 Tax=Jaapia argillacea MUCL 33604 TaxID=933084 RepID=A0A067Q319_9AGAM|nr:hypothetical protein JAAARDRAFT_30812 [Jaapia argillacea MUCL 33604]
MTPQNIGSPRYSSPKSGPEWASLCIHCAVYDPRWLQAQGRPCSLHDDANCGVRRSPQASRSAVCGVREDAFMCDGLARPPWIGKSYSDTSVTPPGHWHRLVLDKRRSEIPLCRPVYPNDREISRLVLSRVERWGVVFLAQVPLVRDGISDLQSRNEMSKVLGGFVTGEIVDNLLWSPVAWRTCQGSSPKIQSPPPGGG